jgi:hypothetical protein
MESEVGRCSVLPNNPANSFAKSNGSRKDHQLAGPTVNCCDCLAELAATTLNFLSASGHDAFRAFYTLEGSAGEHRVEVIIALLEKMLPPRTHGGNALPRTQV